MMPVLALAGASAAAVADLRTGRIFNWLTLSLTACALLAAWHDGALVRALAGFATGGGLLGALYAITRRRGIGLGDVKLGAGLGAALGPDGAALALAAAFVAGGAYGAWLLAARGARPDARVRFGPFLAAGTYLTVLTGFAR